MLPPELGRWAHLRYIKEKVKGNEWSAECPVCGDAGHKWDSPSDVPDRFHMHAPNHIIDAWHGKCRRCGFFAVADDEEWQPRSYYTERELRKIKLEENARRKLAEQEARRMEEKIKWLQEEAFWRGFHARMSEEQREEWRKEGISDVVQDRMMLGYVSDKSANINGTLVKVPALSIPYFDLGWEAVNVQYRLLGTDDVSVKGDRYRFTSGLRAPLYLTDPDEKPKGRVLLLEGAKKALVLYLELVLKADKRDLCIVACPSKYPNEYQLQWLDEADVVYVGLDPDAHERMPNQEESYVDRAVDMVGRERARVVDWPDKPDDLIVKGYGTARDLLQIISQARRA